MKIIKIKILAIFLSAWILQFLLLIFGPISYAFLSMSLVLLILSLAMILFSAGVAVRVPNISLDSTPRLTNVTKIKRKGMAIICLAFYASYFYTGLDPVSVYLNLISGISNYNEYQIYFAESELGSFTVGKMPAIISLFLVKMYFYWVVYQLIFLRNNRYLYSLLFSIISLVHISIARGTFFEIFEIILSICFFSLYGNIVAKRSNVKLIFLAVIIFLFATIIHSQVVALRYGDIGLPTTCDHAMCLDENSFLNQYLTSISKLFYSLNGYFSFGYIYLAHLVEFFYEAQISLAFMPSELLVGSIKPRFLCESYIDCAAFWSPSFEGLVLNLSLIGALIFIFVLGVALSFLLKINKVVANFHVVILIYFIFLYFFSLPVGYLFSSSTPNVLIAMFAVFKITILICKSNIKKANAIG